MVKPVLTGIALQSEFTPLAAGIEACMDDCGLKSEATLMNARPSVSRSSVVASVRDS